MSSMASPRAALADTTAAVLNQPVVEPTADSSAPLSQPQPPSAALAESPPAKSKRRGWDKSRKSLPKWVTNNNGDSQSTDSDVWAAVTPLDSLPPVVESNNLVESNAPLTAAESCAAAEVPVERADITPTAAQTNERAGQMQDANIAASTAAIAPATSVLPATIGSTATTAATTTTGTAKPPTAPYHTRSRQQSAHNATFSHSTRNRSASPTPLAAAPTRAPTAAVPTRRTGSIATVSMTNSKSSHAASAASLLSQAASMVNKSKGRAATTPTADSAGESSRSSKRALSKKDDAGHKRRKSTEVNAEVEVAAPTSDNSDVPSKLPPAPIRQSIAGRPSVGGSARSQRQSLSVSHSSLSSPRTTPTKLRSYSRLSVSASPLQPCTSSSIGIQTSPSAVESDLQARLAAATSAVSSAQQYSQSLQSQLQSSELELSRLTNNQVALQSQILQLTVQHQDMRTESAVVKERLRCEEERSGARQRRVDECEAEMGRLQLAVARLEAEAREAEQVRRRLHAYVEEMRGNVRVMVRVRPTLPHESTATSDTFAYTRDHNTHILEVSGKEERSVDGTTMQRKKQQFVFDHVFVPATSQAELFEQVKSLTVSVLDGYDVLIFAYGQTGSGKSFSMEGPAIAPVLSNATLTASSSTSASASAGSAAPRHRHTPTSFSLQSDAQYEQRGLIQRSVEQLFADLNSRKAKGWSFHLQLSVLELYNDSIRDLLVDRDTDKHEIRQVHRRLHSGESDWQQLGEPRDDKLDVVVSNVHTVLVACPADVYPLLDRARLARASGATEANAHSSRSHLIVRLHVQASHAALQQRSDASLHLIDLAGSERVKSSKAEGGRLKETAAINRSLSALADVIQALSTGDKHVPYRNSRLTHLLQPYLSGGGSKSLCLVNLSPLDEHVGESLCSLRFAQTVSGCGGKRR